MKVPERSNRIHELFVIDARSDQIDSITREIKNDRRVSDVNISRSKSARVVGSLKCTCAIGKTIVSSKSFVTSAVGRPDGTIELTVFGNDNAMKDLLTRLEEHGTGVSIDGWSSRNGSGLLSVKQELVLKAALECGYFDFPKKIRLRELARNVGVAPSSLAESLRSAERKILGEYVKSKATSISPQ